MSPEAYETLLSDALAGDPTLFMRWDQVEQAWDAIDTIQEVWKNNVPTDFPNYKAGSWGPEAANELLARQGHAWVSNTQNIEK